MGVREAVGTRRNRIIAKGTEERRPWTRLGHRKRSTTDSRKRREESSGAGGVGKRGEILRQREGRGNKEGKEGRFGRKEEGKKEETRGI